MIADCGLTIADSEQPVTSIGDDGLCDEALDRTSEMLARKLVAAVALEGVSSEALDKCRMVSGSAVLQRELLRRAIARNEIKFGRLSEALENIGAKLGRQRRDMRYLDAAIEMEEVR